MNAEPSPVELEPVVEQISPIKEPIQMLPEPIFEDSEANTSEPVIDLTPGQPDIPSEPA
jgi:hypothetical protein